MLSDKFRSVKLEIKIHNYIDKFLHKNVELSK